MKAKTLRKKTPKTPKTPKGTQQQQMNVATAAHQVVRKVSQRTGVSPTKICGPTRPAGVVMARQMCYWLLRLQGWGYTEIGQFFNRDHGAVMHGCLAVNIRFDLEPRFKMFWPEYEEFRVAGPKYEPDMEGF